MKVITRTRVEKAQMEFNKICGKTQTAEQFRASVDERLKRALAEKPKKKRKPISANRSLFNHL